MRVVDPEYEFVDCFGHVQKYMSLDYINEIGRFRNETYFEMYWPHRTLKWHAEYIEEYKIESYLTLNEAFIDGLHHSLEKLFPDRTIMTGNTRL